LAAKILIYIVLLFGLSLIFLLVPGCCLLINAYLKLPSILTLIITFIWSFILLSSLHYLHKNYFDYFEETPLENEQLADHTTLEWNAKKEVNQVLKFFIFSVLSRIIILWLLINITNFVLLPSIVIDLGLLSECQQNVSIYGLLLGLLFISLGQILNRQNKNNSSKTSTLS
jgi:hypothetical protein